MDKHPFDNTNRILAKDAKQLDVHRWRPPVINQAGHLVYAEQYVSGRRDAGNSTADKSGSAGSREASADADAGKKGYDDGFAKGKIEGIAAGREEGLAAGKQEASQVAQAELKPKLTEINRLLTNLTHSLNEEDYKLEQTLLHLVQEIAKGVIRRELQIDPGQIMKVIKEVISALPPNRDNIKILLHPTDKKIVDEAIQHGGENWRAVADEDITPGGCKLETEQSMADFTVETRLQMALDQLQEAQVVCPKPGEPGYEKAPEPALKAAIETPNQSAEEVTPDSPAQIATTDASGEQPASPSAS